MTTAHAVTTMTTDRVNLINEDQTRSVLFALFKHIANTAGTHTDEHFDKVRSADGEEWNVRLTGNRTSEKGLTRSRRAYHENTFGDFSSNFTKSLRIFEEINAHLTEQGLFTREASIVDATIVAAAPSTKNKAKQRDPEMKQTKKGNQWLFGLKAHIGVDVTMAGALVREDDKRVYGDAGYTGMWKYLGEEKDAKDSKCCIAAKRGTLKKMEEGPVKTLLLAIEKPKASIRAKVEHPFHVAKNQAQIYSLFGLANLVLATRCESRASGISAS